MQVVCVPYSEKHCPEQSRGLPQGKLMSRFLTSIFIAVDKYNQTRNKA